ncbi:FtsX-like permease family protein [Micromonospora sp. NPDC003197]
MRLVLRRARQARGLLLAAGVAAAVATVLVTGLASYNQQAIEAGQRNVVQAAPAAERSLLISGSSGRTPADFAGRDTAVRARFTAGLGGQPTTVTAARYGTGRELTGDLGAAAPSNGEPVFAAMVTLEGLPEHAELLAGTWPAPGGTPMQVALPERVAAGLGLTVGSRIPLTDRATKQASEVVVAGIWQPRDVQDPYWLLAPDAVSSSIAYGPFVLDPADFARTFTGTTSVSWLVEPDFRGADAAVLADVVRDAEAAAADLPAQAGLGSSGQALTAIDRLGERLARADLVGRSALLTPLLLIVVIGGYALLLVAALLNEDRRAQNALLRARGAARHQLAGFAAREAALVVLPGALLAPLLTSQVLRYADRSSLLSGLALDPQLTLLTWLVAGVAGGGCLLMMLGPALRRGTTYIADLAARSRPDRSATVQRASVDIALVALALLAWFQLRQYSSPLAGTGDSLGIDPLLAAAPILGVLAGAVIALRLLPPATRFAERFVDRRPWTATMIGMWQAGRRPHAGPVLLLALAVGSSTLAFSLSATWERSLTDQADHRIGADLRVTERGGVAPVERSTQLAGLSGVRAVAPAWRDDVRLGSTESPATVLALDAATVDQVMRFSNRLVDDTPRALFDRMTAARVTATGVDLSPEDRKLTGVASIVAWEATQSQLVTTSALFTSPDGRLLRIPLARTDSAGSKVRFAVDLPDAGGQPLRLVGFDIDVGVALARGYGLRLTELSLSRSDGTSQPVDLGTGKWSVVDGRQYDLALTGATPGVVSTNYPVPLDREGRYQGYLRFVVTGDPGEAPVPAVVTPAVLSALSVEVGETVTVRLSGASVPIVVLGVAEALPGTDDDSAALLLDLPSAVVRMLHGSMTVRPPSEWWLATNPGQHTEAAEAAARLAGATVQDRLAVAREAGREPYWLGARGGLLTAALGAVLLALVGLGVDVWATARRRLAELTVLHTLGAGPRLLARALVTEQAFLASIGVVVGLVVGGAVSATVAPMVILTPAAGRPVPEPAFELPWLPVGAIGIGLLLVAMLFSGLIAATVRQRVAAAQLRIGGER